MLSDNWTVQGVCLASAGRPCLHTESVGGGDKFPTNTNVEESMRYHVLSKVNCVQLSTNSVYSLKTV